MNPLAQAIAAEHNREQQRKMFGCSQCGQRTCYVDQPVCYRCLDTGYAYDFVKLTFERFGSGGQVRLYCDYEHTCGAEVPPGGDGS